jgi:hypothetical protein
MHLKRNYTAVFENIYRNIGSILVEALCYKPEGHGFETQWVKLIFPIYILLPAALGPGIYPTSNRNEYQKHKNNVSGEQSAADA